MDVDVSAASSRGLIGVTTDLAPGEAGPGSAVVRPLAFDVSSRLPKWIAKLGRPALAAKLLFPKPDLDGYRMGEVNSHGERRASERVRPCPPSAR